MRRFGADLLMELAPATGNYLAGSTPKATARNRPTPAILFGEPAGPHLGNGNGWVNDRQESVPEAEPKEIECRLSRFRVWAAAVPDRPQ